MSRTLAVPRGWVGSVSLLAALVATGVTLGAWKYASVREANAAAASQPEPVGTVSAVRSITLRNEVPGTIRRVALGPGRIVDAGTVLVAFDVSVEEAELRAQEAQAELAQTLLARTERMTQRRAASQVELDNARAERDIALAQVARTRAIIARKTIRAPFRARVGISDVHAGQFLETGTQLTTLQGVDEAAHVDFAVAQSVAATLRDGQTVQVHTADAA